MHHNLHDLAVNALLKFHCSFCLPAGNLYPLSMHICFKLLGRCPDPALALL